MNGAQAYAALSQRYGDPPADPPPQCGNRCVRTPGCTRRCAGVASPSAADHACVECAELPWTPPEMVPPAPPPKQHRWDPYCRIGSGTRGIILCVDCGGHEPTGECIPRPGWRENCEARITRITLLVDMYRRPSPPSHRYHGTLNSAEAVLMGGPVSTPKVAKRR